MVPGWRWSVSLLVVGLTACSDLLSPWGTEGTYRADEVNGRTVPAVIFERIGSSAFAVRVEAGELRLRGDGSFRLDLAYAEIEPTAEVRYEVATTGRWARDDRGVVLEYTDPTTGRWRSIAATSRRGTLELTLPAAGVGVSMRVLFAR